MHKPDSEFQHDHPLEAETTEYINAPEPRDIFNGSHFGANQRRTRIMDKERKNKRRAQRRARVKNR